MNILTLRGLLTSVFYGLLPSVLTAETESKVQPDGVGDDLAGKPIAAIAGQLTRHPFTLPASG